MKRNEHDPGDLRSVRAGFLLSVVGLLGALVMAAAARCSAEKGLGREPVARESRP